MVSTITCVPRRWLSSRTTFRLVRNELFTEEKAKQTRNIGLIEKIKVEVAGIPENCTLVMNKNLSTPYNCAMHINESVVQHAAGALVNDQLWDMHKPLREDCSLKFLYYTDADPTQINKIYWRSCSFILGYILETALKDDHTVLLHSWPAVNYRSGSFVYDAFLDLPSWKPTNEELLIMGRHISQKLRVKDIPFEPLDVDISLARKMFAGNKFKVEQLEAIAESNEKKGRIPLYRMGDHIDISKGPMISSTKQLGYYSVTAVHKFEAERIGPMYRIQGVSVPFTQRINSWTWEIVCKSATPMNSIPFALRSSNVPPSPVKHAVEQ